jgi:rod shape-determining protein MreD
MRWGAFVIALVAVCVLQTAVIAPAGPWLARPVDLFLALALLCGLLAPPRDAPIAGWIVGMAQDLNSLDALGSHAIALAAAAWAAVCLREWLRVDYFPVRALLCFVAAILGLVIATLLNGLHARLWSDATIDWLPGAAGVLRPFIAAFLAAAAAQVLGMTSRRSRAYRGL